MALLLVFVAQAALFGLVAWLSYLHNVDNGPRLGRELSIAEWRMDLMALLAALALTTAALVVLVLRLYRQQAVTSESEQRFRRLIEQSIDGVVIHRDGIVLFANDAMAAILGLHSGAELTGRSLFQFVPQDPRNRGRTRRWNTGSSGQPLARSRREGRTADARTVHLDILSQPVDWRGLPAIRSTVNDVTDQVILAERERRQTAILSAVNDAHSIYLNETRAGLSFDQLLTKILQISGCEHGVIAEKVDDAQGNTTIRILAASGTTDTGGGQGTEDSDGVASHGLQAFLGEPTLTGSVTIINQVQGHPAAGPADVIGADVIGAAGAAVSNVMLLPLKLDKEVLGEIALANRDGGFKQDLVGELSPILQAITRIVADYRSTRLREAAEQASKLKSVFLAHMNHELRTPLSGVIANLELLRDTSLSTEQHELVHASMSAGKGMLSVIGNTLDLSKIEAEALTLDTAEFDLAAMLESIRSIYQAAAQEKHTTLSTSVCASAPCHVVADEMRLRQILSNLVSNSVKFTAMGRIRLSVRAEQTGAQTAWLHFTVDDTGIGFAPEEAGFLFKPFQQANQSITRDFGGTGLGLAIAHKLVALHGGEIACDAAPSKGCSFTVSIPVTVTDWNRPPAPRLDDYAIVVLAPQSPPAAELVDGLRAAGALMQVVGDPANIRTVAPAGSQRQPVLVVDWACTAERAEALVADHGSGFARILAVVPHGDARRRRRWLKAGDIGVIAPPLTAAGLAAALGDTRRVTTIDRKAEREDPMAGVHIFTPDGAPRLLVVEDQPMNQKVLQRQLERLGIDCQLAENGQAALDLLAHIHYDVIITDCSMPVMDGLELTRRVRAQEAEGRQRSTIIALTANAITGSAQACYEAGADAYLSKPLKLAELSATLMQWHNAAPATNAGNDGTNVGDKADATASPSEDDAAPAIDRAALARLIGQDDPAAIDQIAREFFYSWQDSLSALDHLLKQQDAEGLAEAAHAAKGTAHYGAAERLATVCASLEALARSERWTEAAAAVQDLKCETRRLQTSLTTSGLIQHEQLRSA
ncbi:MAG: ATP-binding protein [Kiloniellaceae bacterium]